jgi:putative spermidine/putrescine transport system substrate-binding protein
MLGKRSVIVAGFAGAAVLTLAACSSSGGSSGSAGAASSGSSGAGWAKAQSVAAGGGMDALVSAAKAEGTLNVITLPRTWAGYGAILDGFTAKYGIKINIENPDGSSGDEINAVKSTKGQPSAPDVLDIGNSYALRQPGGAALAVQGRDLE